jgi:Zn-dependent protease
MAGVQPGQPSATGPARAGGGIGRTWWRDPQILVAVGLMLLAAYGLRHEVSTTTLLILVVVIPSIMLHEIAHGVVALACGDDTAKRAGRLTLNPIRHIDPLGTIILPVLLALAGLGAFGYAKPVPINPSRMRHPRNDSVLVSLAGPATNVALAAVSFLVLRYACAPDTGLVISYYGLGAVGVGIQLLYLLGFLNLTLAVFNALPIPPLDGSVLVERLLPSSALPAWWNVRRYAMIGLLVLVLLDPGQFLTHIFASAEQGWNNLLTS